MNKQKQEQRKLLIQPSLDKTSQKNSANLKGKISSGDLLLSKN